MKARKIVLFVILLFACRAGFAQSLESSITIIINNGNYVVSGIVESESVKNEVVEKLKAQLSGNIDSRNITVQPNAQSFQMLWQKDFDKALLKIKKWKTGIFIFSSKVDSSDTGSARLPDEILNARFTLSNGKTVSLKDYKNKMVVLFFLASWCGPCRTQAESLRDFYPQIASRKVEIIGVGADNDKGERTDLPKLFKILNLPFQNVWTTDEIVKSFIKISKFEAIPQVFIILNERLYGVFMGGGQKADEKLKETILKVADENNL